MRYSQTAPLALLLAFSAATAQTEPASLTLSHRTGCTDLPGICHGGGTKAELSLPSGSGAWIVALGKYRMSHAHIDEGRSFENRYILAEASLKGSVRGQGHFLTLDRSARGEHVSAQAGFYIHHIEAEANLDGRAGITLKPQTVNIPVPALTYNGRVIAPASQFSITTPAYTAAYERHENKQAKGLYGGLRLDLRAGMSLPHNFAASAVLHGRAGFDILRSGAGFELLWSSSPDPSLGVRPGSLFTGAPLRSSARYAFALGVWREQDHANKFYDAELEALQRQVGKYETRIADAQTRLDRAVDRARADVPDVLEPFVRVPDAPRLAAYAPRLDARDILDSIGVHDPKVPRYAVSLRGSFRVTKDASISATVLQPVGGDQNSKPRIEIAASYDF